MFNAYSIYFTQKQVCSQKRHEFVKTLNMQRPLMLYRTVLGFVESQPIDFPSWMENVVFEFDNAVYPCYHLSFVVNHTSHVRFYVNVFIHLDSTVIFETLFTDFGQYERLITRFNDLDLLLDSLYGSPVATLHTAARRSRQTYST